jgi:DNA-binding CsgD family transcriptional regulator/tetratricopeptide (TPR) repeat protein
VELIERDYALQRLQDALALAAQGAGRTALVYGEAGIGKTSLVQCLAAAHRHGRLLRGWCEALFSPQPLGPLYDMADALSARTQDLLGSEGGRAGLFASLLADLRAFDGTTLLILEDLHWADAATLDLAKYLARRVQHINVLLVLTYRDDELDDRHPLRLLFGELQADVAVRIPLLPLSEAAVIDLARRGGHSSEGLYAVTGGNPFFVTEALCADGMPATVRDAVLARAARQPPPVRAILDLAAIVPARIDMALVDALLAPTHEDIAAVLSSGLLSADGGAYAYRHELARIAVEQALPAPVAASLHARVLHHLEHMRDVPPARLVHHAAGAGDSAAVMNYAPRAAANAAMHGSHCDAAWLYGRALAHAHGLDDEARAELLERHAYQCHLTSQIELAIQSCQAALAIWRQRGNALQEGHMLRWLSRMCWIAGRNSDAETYADLAVQLLQAQNAGSELTWAMSNRAQLHMLAGHTAAAAQWGQQAIERATRDGDTEILAHALNNVGTAISKSGNDEGYAMIERSLALSLEHDYAEHAARAYANLTSAAVTRRDYAGARWHISRAASFFSERDLDSWSHYVVAYQARLDFETGHWEDAGALASQLLARADVTPITRIPALAVVARIRLRHGDPGGETLLEELTRLACATGELQRLAPVAAARAELAWLRDERALDDPIVQQTCNMAVTLNDERALGELMFWCRLSGCEWTGGGDMEPAYAMQLSGDWRGATHEWLGLGCPYEQAFALLQGDEAAVTEALALFASLQACAVVKRCREHLLRAGMRGIARGPRATTSADPAGLTLRERQILALLAEGLSNIEIACRLARSEKTVEHHVSAVLRKLDAHSRGEAVAMAGRLGLHGPH